MAGALPLGKRVFLLAFLPLCLTLAGSFVAISQAIRSEIRTGLSESLQRSEAARQRASAEARRRDAGLLRVLGENPGLKAGIALLQQGDANPEDLPQIRNTIEDQLRELAEGLSYGLYVVRDAANRPIAAITGDTLSPAPLELAVPAAASALVTVGGVLYETVTVPIFSDGDPLGALTVGRRFDLHSLGYAGELMLLRNGKPVLSTIPQSRAEDLAAGLERNGSASRCELHWNGREYLAMPIHREDLGKEYRLVSLQSIDDQLEPFTRNLGAVCLKIGAWGLVIALAISIVASRSITRPLRGLLERLNASEATGAIPSDLATGTSSYEVNLLAGAINRAACDVNRAKSEFLANMTHELRTPLNAVIGYSEMVAEELTRCGHAELVADVEKIRSAGKYQLALVDAILDFSEIEAGKVTVLLEQVDVRSMVDDVAGAVLPIAARNANRLQTRCEDGIGSITADAGKMRQVLLNLLANACKFTEAGEVSLSAYRRNSADGRALLFEVSDTGIGITPEQMGRLFQPFSLGDGSSTRKHGGTGLGLVISKRFCEMMGGRIEVESAPGRGSRFIVTLPDEERG